MSKSKIPKSIRKYLRREKAKIRRTPREGNETEVKITDLIQKVMNQHRKKISFHDMVSRA